ncbi:MAG: hypothetical protein Q9191_001144 [Dirinaria sp. TL-2023a]
MAGALRIGYVPEHFSTPLYFAKKHFGLSADLLPFPSGTGHMVTSLQQNEIDIGIGLTEGWISALGKQEAPGFTLVGTYVETPLCWAISTGSQRDLNNTSMLEGKRIGVSRIGSGSYVMGFVLADFHSWLRAPDQSPFEVVPLQTFTKLRDAVNDGTADFFMWEYFTSKRYYDNGAIKKIGEIYTPWSSWKIVATKGARDTRLDDLFNKLNQGIRYFDQHPDEAVKYISTELDYSEEDAQEWLKTVRFATDAKGVKMDTVEKTVEILQKAGVVGEDVNTAMMVGIAKEEE